MLRLLADENFNGRLLRALQRRIPELDVVRVQDTDMCGADDPTLLQWAAEEDRVVLTHDIATLVGFAYQRVRSGQAMPGVIAIRTDCPLGQAIEDLEILLLAGQDKDISSQVFFVPL